MGKYDRLTDEQLIERLRAGESEIMDHLMVKYKSMVRKKARAMYLLGGENEDLIQSRRPSGLRKTNHMINSLAHRTTWLRSDFVHGDSMSGMRINWKRMRR